MKVERSRRGSVRILFWSEYAKLRKDVLLKFVSCKQEVWMQRRKREVARKMCVCILRKKSVVEQVCEKYKRVASLRRESVL